MALETQGSGLGIDNRFSPTDARDRVIREYDLIHHRMTWMLTTNAFLLAAFGAFQSTAIADGPLKSEMEWLTAYVGLVIALSCTLGIFAALTAIIAWIRRIESKDRFITSAWKIDFAGSLPSAIIGPTFGAVWSLLLWDQSWRGEVPWSIPLVAIMFTLCGVTFLSYYALQRWRAVELYNRKNKK